MPNVTYDEATKTFSSASKRKKADLAITIAEPMQRDRERRRIEHAAAKAEEAAEVEAERKLIFDQLVPASSDLKNRARSRFKKIQISQEGDD